MAARRKIKIKEKLKKRRQHMKNNLKQTTNSIEDKLKVEKNITEKTSNNIETVASYPTNSTAVSSNWMKLIKTLQISTDSQKDGMMERKLRKTAETKLTPDKTTLPSQEEEIWFDNVDMDLLDLPQTKRIERVSEKVSLQTGPLQSITKTVAMDCEMVGIGEDGRESMLARVSIVNSQGNCIYDKYVKPREKVTDYRTAVSGIRPESLKNGEDFETVQKEVYEIINHRILVGHAIYNDLEVLYLDHPRSKIRDTSKYKPFRAISNGNTPSLKRLAVNILKVKVQEGEHNSVQDAQAAMRLYTMHRKEWELEILKKRKAKLNKSNKKVKLKQK